MATASGSVPWSESPTGTPKRWASVAIARRFWLSSGTGYDDTQCSNATGPPPLRRMAASAAATSSPSLMPVDITIGLLVRATRATSGVLVTSPLAIL